MNHKIETNFKNHLTAGMNANSLISNGPSINNNKLSFANEFAKMREQAGSERSALPKLTAEEIPVLVKETKTEKVITTNMSASLVQEIQEKVKDIRDKELVKEKQTIENFEESQKTAEEIANKYNHSESMKAEVSQSNSKTITEAVKEGNQAAPEYQQHDGNDRKRQLAKWEDMAPRITEDPTNKAIRIDIPGLYDIETLIVRTNKGAVTVQAIGSKEAMTRLQGGQAELAGILRKHNINLASLTAYDSDVVHSHMARNKTKQAA